MKKYISSLFVFFLSQFCLAANSTEVDEILIKYKSGIRPASTETSRYIGYGVYAVKVSKPLTPHSSTSSVRAAFRQKIRALQSDPSVIYAEPDYPGTFADLPSQTDTPNDPGFSAQSWLEKFNARQAWAVASGKNITVAVIDSGVDLSHPDLIANLRSDGYNFGDGNSTPQDVFGHGTFVAGIIAANCNNNLGGCGLAPKANILPIKINPAGIGTFKSSAVAQAIDYATERGAKVINLSLSIDEETQTVEDALKRAIEAGVTIVAAAGNHAGAVRFPATFPGVIAVAGINSDDSLYYKSNIGPEIVIAAQATAVQSTINGGTFGLRGEGTSFAAPMVAAAAANILSMDLRIPSARISQYLRETARKLPSPEFQFGALDAGKLALSLLPDLSVDKRKYSKSDKFSINYSLPVTAGKVDIYAGLSAPYGEFILLSSGKWDQLSNSKALPFASNYSNTKRLGGGLFSESGIFPSIELSSIPAGKYTWKTAIVNSDTGEIIGSIIETPVEVLN